MANKFFHHALYVSDKICTGCTHCMNACPTQAIRINNGIAVIEKNKCIDCGKCFDVCPVNAIKVKQDDFDLIHNYKVKVLLLPYIFLGQFSKKIKPEYIISVLKEFGISHVSFVEESGHYLKEEMLKYQDVNKIPKPLISAFCPSIVRLIQVRFPSLLEHVVLLNQPIDITAKTFQQKFINEGYKSDEIGIFYVTPCAAKIAAIKSPEGKMKSDITGVINMNYLYDLVYSKLSANNECYKTEFSVSSAHNIRYGLTKGESSFMKGRALAIDGINNVIDFLEKFENEEIKNVSFLELRACHESCAGGILTVENRFITTERLLDIAKKCPEISKDTLEFTKQIQKNNLDYKLDKLYPRASLILDENIDKAMQKLTKIRKMMCYFPGFDCGACGAPTCQALAEDIVNKNATISQCVFLQKVMVQNNKLHNEHALKITEKVWGKNRLNKNCTKKGAIHESN